MARETLKTEYAVQKIKELLFFGQFQRGEKLPSETRLAADLCVGRSSVREALRQLSALGYVEIIHNRGAFAAMTAESEIPLPRSWLKIDADQATELLDVISCIEPFSAALCSEHICEDRLHQLKKQLDYFESTLDSRDQTALAQYDLEFHRIILSESKNRYFIQMYQPLLEAFMQYGSRSFAVTYPWKDTLSEHRAVYNAIAIHSPEKARLAMQLHMTITKRRVKFKNKKMS